MMVPMLAAVRCCWMVPWEDEIVDVLHVSPLLVLVPMSLVLLEVEGVGFAAGVELFGECWQASEGVVGDWSG